VTANGIRMHVAEQGRGPLVVLCHGFPECWYSWRHQIPALAEAGYRAAAPDQRGYGHTDRPEAVEAYHVLQLAADAVGLVHALGEERAAIVGHDWGAAVAWHAALLRPDVFYAVALLSVPYLPRVWSDVRPTEAMARMAGDKQFYQLYFQEPGKAEAELEADVRRSLRMFYYAASGDAPPEKRWRFLFEPSERFLDSGGEPAELPAWLSKEDLDYFVGEFERTGFRGGLNWYRNIDQRWALLPVLAGAKLRQPTLFVAGDVDPVIAMYRRAYDTLEQHAPNLARKVLLPGAGHWVQQERPAEVNRLLLEFLRGL
jgi:pimeloyl-ACP methyl ester carboxylesterase